MSEPIASRLAHPRPLYCRVTGLCDATPEIRIVRLDIVSGGPLRFAAGQYARVAFGESPPRAFSIASRPDQPFLEFHVRHVPSGGAASAARQLRLGDSVWVEGPFGDAWLRKQHPGPLLAVAGGAGLAPMKSIVETALFDGFRQPVGLYVGSRNRANVYLEDHFVRLSQVFPNFHYVVGLSAARSRPRYRLGMISDILRADIVQFSGAKAYVAGPRPMVEATRAVLLAHGIALADIHADLACTSDTGDAGSLPELAGPGLAEPELVGRDRASPGK